MITFPNNYLANITILTIFATILDRSNCKTMGKKILLLFMMVWLSVGVNAHKGSCDATWLGESKTPLIFVNYNKTGIFFQKALGPGRANHIDVWNGSLRKPRAGSGLYISGEMWFWEIK